MPGVVRPDEGSQPSAIANTICSSRPNQNAGTEMPATAAAPTVRSIHDPRAAADAIPAGSAIASAPAIATPTSSSVAGTRSAMRATTGRPSLKL